MTEEQINQIIPILTTVSVTLVFCFLLFISYLYINLKGIVDSLTEKLDTVIKELMVVRLDANAALNMGPETRGLMIRPKLNRVMHERFNFEELEEMASDLGLNGTVVYTGGKTVLIKTILDAVVTKNRLVDVALWMNERRKDIVF